MFSCCMKWSFLGGFTTDKVLTFQGALKDIKLPKQGDVIAIIFTTFVEATRFYINLMNYSK